MKRFAAVAFSALVVATVGAFFVTQHLKVSTPLISGSPRPTPLVINPYGARCGAKDHGRMRISFYLQYRSDDVSVYMVDLSGNIVRTLASGRHMRKGVRHPDGDFSWNGREDNGSVAPDGNYYVRVALLHQGRTAEITDSSGHPIPVRVKTTPPRPRITSVTVGSGSAPVISPPLPAGEHVTIHYTGTEHRSGIIQIYRTDVPGKPQLVKHFKTAWKASSATWDGMIARQPPLQGTYLVGMKVIDAACNVGRFPVVLPPPAGSTPHAGVTIRYLAAQAPLTPVPAGSRATVYVAAGQQRYSWTLWRAGAHKSAAHGVQQSYQLRVKMPPAQDAGLYHVVITTGTRRTDVPLLADHPGVKHRPRILVVLPALTWQGENPVDDPPLYDGVPNTLDNGGPVLLARPLVDGLPASYPDEAALLAYLDRAHLPYDLTTDLALASGIGPTLSAHRAVVLAGSETWLPTQLVGSLRSYVENGGHLLSLGTESMLRRATVQSGQGLSPSGPAATDIFGARPGPITSTGGELILVVNDSLRLFSGTSGGFSGYRTYQPIQSPSTAISEAGVSDRSPAIVAFRVGRGIVVEIGLPGLGASLAGNVDAKELVGRMWSILGR